LTLIQQDETMLGRTRRTTRLDVSLALAFTGIAYLVWALAAGTARNLIQDMILVTNSMGEEVPNITSNVKIVFVDAGVAIDLVGLAWLAVSLLLVVFAGRQKFSISWAWVSAICQSFVAAWGTVLVAWAAFLPFGPTVEAVAAPASTTMEKVSGLSLPVVLVVAMVVWGSLVLWLIFERSRFFHRGPTVSDSMRTNV
jgi:hypothetical protein